MDATQITNKEFGAFLKALGELMILSAGSAEDVRWASSSEDIAVRMTKEGIDGERALSVIEACRVMTKVLVPPKIQQLKLTVAVIHCPVANMDRFEAVFSPKFDLYFFGTACTFGELEAAAKNFDKVIFIQTEDSLTRRAQREMCFSLAGPRFFLCSNTTDAYARLNEINEKQSVIQVALKPGEEKCGFCGYVGVMVKEPGQLDPCPECKGV